MSRSKWKGPYFKSFFQNLKRQGLKNCVFRSEIILPKLTNKIVRVSNGKSFSLLKVTNLLIGYRFGEFIFTRRNSGYRRL